MSRRKMPPGERRVSMTIRLSAEHHEALKRLAELENHTIAVEIDNALNHHITTKSCSPRVLLAESR